MKARKSVNQAIKKDTQEIKNKSKQIWETGKERFYDAEEKVEAYISDNPKRALAISAAIGAVVGILFASSWNRRRM